MSQKATAKVEKEIERQNGVVSVIEKSENNALNYRASLPAQVMVVSTRGKELLSGTSAASKQMSKTTALLRPARHTISTQSEEVASIHQLKTFTESLEEKVAFCESRKDCLKSELAAATTERARFGHVFENICAEVPDSLERLGARDAVIWSIIEDWCALLGPPFRSLVDSLRTGLITSMSEAFRAGSPGS